MRSSPTPSQIALRAWPTLLVLMALMAMSSAAHAQVTVFTVGEISDPSCDYYSTRDALIAVAARTGIPVKIHNARSEDASLGYTWPGTDSAVLLVNPQTDITLVGGYASCGAATPTAGQYTRLTYTSNVDADADFTMLAINNFTSRPRHKLNSQHILAKAGARRLQQNQNPRVDEASHAEED